MKMDMAGLPRVATPFHPISRAIAPAEIRVAGRAGQRAARGHQLVVGADQEGDEVGRGRAGVVLIVDGADRVLDPLQVSQADVRARRGQLADQRRPVDRAPVFVALVLLVEELLRGLGIPVVQVPPGRVDAVRHLRERYEPLPLLGPVAQRGQPRVHLRERRLDRHQAVGEVGDVARAVGVQEVVQRGHHAHRMPELRQVLIPAESREPGQRAGLLVPRREPDGEGQRLRRRGGGGGDDRPVLGPVDGEALCRLPGDRDRLVDGPYRICLPSNS